MYSREEILDRLMERVSSRAMTGMREVLSDILERELSKALGESLQDQSFSSILVEELRDGLSVIYKEISMAKRSESPDMDQNRAAELFNEASDQLDHILKTTEQATVQIMDIVEHHLDRQHKAELLLSRIEEGGDPASLEQLRTMHQELNTDLMQIMTSLSFQDITGQRIKRIIQALRTIESTVFDLYLSTGLALKAYAAEPGKDIEQIKQESKKRVSELKGPSSNAASQSEVDDLLTQLGMD